MSGLTPGLAETVAETLATDAHIERHPTTQPTTIADEPPKIVTRDDVSDASDLESLAEDADAIDAPEKAAGGPRMLNGAPMPDLRFEQAYLTALRRTDMTPRTICRVTLVDFLLWPMAQGFLWALGLNGFRYLRTASTSNGRQFGLVLRDFLNIGGILD